MAKWSTRRAAISAIVLIAGLVLAAVPGPLRTAGDERPFETISNQSQSANLQLALNKLSPQRPSAPKRSFRVDIQVESSASGTVLVLLGRHGTRTEAVTLSPGERSRTPIRAPPAASIQI
jgi:hypothetical protein